MNKVILTKEQAKAMEELKSEHLTGEVVKTHLNDRWSLGLESLNDLTVDEFAQAYYSEDGYEVESGFKVGDNVMNDKKIIVEILEDRSVINSFLVGWIANGKMYREVVSKSSILRHATKEEAWWASHGRKPLEFRERDIIQQNGTVYEVWWVKDDRMQLNDGSRSVSDIYYSSYKVICFAENRLDVKTNG